MSQCFSYFLHVVRASVTQCSPYLTIARALMQKHSFQGGSGSFLFNAVRAGAYWHKFLAFMYMHLLNKISKLGNMANFDHFAKAIERQNGQKLAEFEGEGQKGQKRICPTILMMTKGKAHQAVKGIFIYF